MNQRKRMNPMFMDLQLFATQTSTTNTSGNSLSAEMKTYYEKRLIDYAEPNLVHDQFGDRYPIPVGGGKTIEFRKFSALPKNVTAITEGVTPSGNKLNVTTVTATVNQYGDYIQLSDILQLAAIDPMVEQTTKLLGGQAGRSLDTITREVLCGGTQKLFAPSIVGGTETAVTDRSELTANCKLTADVVFKAAATLKAMNANPIDDCYVAIVHPFVAYDLMRSNDWIEAQKYANPESIYRGEIGRIGQVRFVESTEAKIVAPSAILGGLPNRLKLHTALDSTGSTNILLDTTVTDAQATAVTAAIAAGNNKVYIDGSEVTISSITAGAAGTCKLVASAAVKDKAKGCVICGQGAGADGSGVFLTLVLGASAYGVTELEGGGLLHIVKQLGYGEDPLNQRSSVGWKATKVAERLVEEYMVRIESGSAYSATAESN